MDSDWADALVDGLYTVLLRRAPDLGRAYHRAILRRDGAAGIATVFGEVLRSPEFRRRMLDGLAEPLFREDHGFKHVVSLGTHCYTSFLLKYAGLKAASYPFDWVFSSAGMVEHCLSDDFEQFTDPVNFSRVPDEEKEHGQRYNRYHNTFYLERFGVKYVFNHHDMSDSRSVAYFRRCVDRFRALMQSRDDVLCVQCAPEDDGTFEEFARTCAALDRLSASSALLLIAVSKPRPRAVMPDIALQSERGRHQFYRMTPTSPWRGISFEAPIDDLAVLRTVERRGLAVERRFAPWATL